MFILFLFKLAGLLDLSWGFIIIIETIWFLLNVIVFYISLEKQNEKRNKEKELERRMECLYKAILENKKSIEYIQQLIEENKGV